MTKKPFTLLSLPTTKSTQQVVSKFPFPIELTRGSYKDLKFTFRSSGIKILYGESDIRDFSFVWLTSGWGHRDSAYALWLYLKAIKARHSYVEKSPSKLTDCVEFALSGIPMPDTLFISRGSIKKDMHLIKETCGFPLIVKDVKGCQGKDSVYALGEKDLLEKMKKLPRSKKFIFQRFIPNDYDWGVMVANGVVVSGEKSYPTDGEFRNNTCNGAKECFVDVADIPKEIKDMAIKASGLLGLSWSRTDIIIDKNTSLPYILEVNRYPGITSQSDEVSGAYAFLSSHISSYAS